MDELSEIYADAIENGDGGLVVLWSQDHTLFDGKISAQGGVLGGNGDLLKRPVGEAWISEKVKSIR